MNGPLGMLTKAKNNKLLVCELKGAVNYGVIDTFLYVKLLRKKIVYKTRKSITISCHILVSLMMHCVQIQGWNIAMHRNNYVPLKPKTEFRFSRKEYKKKYQKIF